MNVKCSKCNTSYDIRSSMINAPVVKFKCKVCGSAIVVTQLSFNQKKLSTESIFPVQQESKNEKTKIQGFGIKFKMSVFLIAILALITAQSFYLIVQLTNMTQRFSEKGTQIIKDMAEKDILKTAIFTANQANLYLNANPYLKKEDFLKDPRLKAIATQKVGLTGYTVLYEKTDDERLILRVHRNPKICAPIIPELSMLKERLGVNFPEFWRIQVSATPSKPSVGYYKWQEDNGNFRDKYMACVNIEGTHFYIASTTYIDEFLQPMQLLKSQAKEMATLERNKNAAIVFIISVVVAVMAFTFGGKLSSNIMYLSDVTDRISLGDLDAIIEKKSKDELGVLTDSISRLRNSVKLSMKRLRK